MIAVRENRPFSLDRKIGAVEDSLPVTVNYPCESGLWPSKRNFAMEESSLGWHNF